MEFAKDSLRLVFIFFVSLSVSFLKSCMAAKIVMMPMFANSHYFVFRKIAEELGSRGHKVCVIHRA